jgi:thiol-disulfide isomerase/thioredoxin
LLFVYAASAQIVGEVRGALSRNDVATAERQIADYRAARGVTPEMLEAYSWLGRNALAAKKLDDADKYALETRRMALEQLKTRPLDAEKHLPIALGASIEVQGHVLAQRGNRAEAVAFLQDELKRWWSSSIRTRIQKNINLLTLEGKPAPALVMDRWIGPKPLPRGQWKGRPVLLFFWAHWCGDCKRQAPALGKIAGKYAKDGLLVIAPTQPYGYVARGEEAGLEQELRYVADIWKANYAELPAAGVPVSEENFRNYGASTTPTLVLVNRNGIVTLYHPGNLNDAELEHAIGQAIEAAS